MQSGLNYYLNKTVNNLVITKIIYGYHTINRNPTLHFNLHNKETELNLLAINDDTTNTFVLSSICTNFNTSLIGTNTILSSKTIFKLYKEHLWEYDDTAIKLFINRPHDFKNKFFCIDSLLTQVKQQLNNNNYIFEIRTPLSFMFLAC